MLAERINGVYLPRNPKASPLYGLVEDHFDEFERVYDDRFADKHGFWRTAIRKIVHRFLDCGDLRHGARVAAVKTRIAAMKCCWRSLATEDIFAPHVMPKEWLPSPIG